MTHVLRLGPVAVPVLGADMPHERRRLREVSSGGGMIEYRPASASRPSPPTRRRLSSPSRSGGGSLRDASRPAFSFTVGISGFVARGSFFVDRLRLCIG